MESPERRKAGNTILGDLADKCLIHMAFDTDFSTKQPSRGHKYGVSIQSYINCGKTFFPNISDMKYCTDLILGKAFSKFIFFNFSDSRLSLLKGFHFCFWWRDSENHQLNRRFLWAQRRLILLFVTILQKYTSTLRLVWTRRYCFYHESKMSLAPLVLWKVLVPVVDGASGRRCTRFPESLLLCEYYIHCSLFLQNMLLKRLSKSHTRNKWRVVNIYILPPVRQF